MKQVILFTVTTLLAICFVGATICSPGGAPGNSPAMELFVGSTPAGPVVRNCLKMPAEGKDGEFIKWELTLYPGKSGAGDFKLAVLYGVGKPGTSGFWGGGTKLEIGGNYTSSDFRNEDVDGILYKLDARDFQSPILLVRLDHNIVHFLDDKRKLMGGTEGFGYTLNKAGGPPVLYKTVSGQTQAQTSQKTAALSLFSVFGGRTPCEGMAEQMDEEVNDQCEKIKWRLFLYQDSLTHQPATYKLIGALHRRNDPRQGNWNIITGTKADPRATVYRLALEGHGYLYLQKGSTNVLFFLDQEKNLMAGNRIFSYTLNRVEGVVP